MVVAVYVIIVAIFILEINLWSTNKVLEDEIDGIKNLINDSSKITIRKIKVLEKEIKVLNEEIKTLKDEQKQKETQEF